MYFSLDRRRQVVLQDTTLIRSLFGVPVACGMAHNPDGIHRAEIVQYCPETSILSRGTRQHSIFFLSTLGMVRSDSERRYQTGKYSRNPLIPHNLNRHIPIILPIRRDSLADPTRKLFSRNFPPAPFG
jgi:hypothetical protein